MSFTEVAPKVWRRVLLRRWLAALAGQVYWALAVMGLLVLLGLWLDLPVWLPALALGLWLAAVAFNAWRQSPDEYEALACWDKSADRSEAFAAAWWFEKTGATGLWQRRHVQSQLPLLGSSLGHLARDLPISFPKPLLLALGLLALPSLLRPIFVTPEALLSERERKGIAESAGKLAGQNWDETKLQSLSAEEKKALDALRQSINSKADDLKKNDASAREVLASLDGAARAAESLAERLGSAGREWASAGMIDQLRQHTDTAEFGDAAAGKQAERLGAEASILAAQLRRPDLEQKTQERITFAFQAAADHAEAEDKERLVGKPVLGAAQELAAGRVDMAAAQLESLVSKMQEIAQREAARKQLQNLAQSLREAGGKAGEKNGKTTSGGMSQLNAAGQQPGAGQSPRVAQAPQGAAQAPSNLQPPGLGRATPSQGQTMAPAGQAQPGTQSALGQMRTGQVQKQDGPQPGQTSGPKLIAPVPGKSDPKKDTNVVTVFSQQPPAGDSASVSLPMAGKNPGAGTADLNNTPTQQKKAGNADVVNAANGADGTSSTRQVEGLGTKEESSTLSSTQQALQQLQREESALDDASLPMARREHIRRYFQELRRKFEEN